MMTSLLLAILALSLQPTLPPTAPSAEPASPWVGNERATVSSDRRSSGGDMGVTGRAAHAPVYVDSTQVLYLESYPVQVQLMVTGSLPSPCHEPVWTVEDDGRTIHVELWSEAGLGAMCAAVLEPVELLIPLGDYESADRVVRLNGDVVGRVQVGKPLASGVSVTGSGWSFGMCMGFCRADLDIADDAVTLAAWDHGASEPLFVNAGWLTPEARARLDASTRTIDQAGLDAVYGCPDCADGGAFYLELSSTSATSRHEMEFARPPDELADAYAIAVAIMSALETCADTDLITVADDCAPYPPA